MSIAEMKPPQDLYDLADQLATQEMSCTRCDCTLPEPGNRTGHTVLVEHFGGAWCLIIRCARCKAVPA